MCCVDFSLARSFQRLQERGANREANSIFAADSTASSPRAPLPASEEEEVGPNRRRIQSPLYIARVFLPVECRRPSVLLVLRSSAEGCGGDGSGVGVGDSLAPPFGVGPGRIKFPWVMLCSHPSFVSLELIDVDDDGAGFGAGIFYGEESARSVPMAGSHGFFCASAAAGACRTARMSVLRGGSGNCYGDGTGAAVRRLAYSCLEESGWRFSFGVSLLLVESPADLGAPVLLRLGDGFNGRSSIQACIDYFGVPIAAKDGYKKVDVASSEASSSSWRLASSRVVAVLYLQRRSVGRRLRSPVSRITGRVLQGHGCNFYLFRDVLVSCQCKMLNQ